MSSNRNHSMGVENDPNFSWNHPPIEDLDNCIEDDFGVILKDIPLYYGDDDSRAE